VCPRWRTDDDTTCGPAQAAVHASKEFVPLAQSVLEEIHQEELIAMPTPNDLHAANSAANEAPKFELDFESDEPLPVCPMRRDGSAPDEACEACQ
jgi:hypothetical protein